MDRQAEWLATSAHPPGRETVARGSDRAARQAAGALPAQKVDEHVAEGLNVIAARLLQALVRVDARVARGACSEGSDENEKKKGRNALCESSAAAAVARCRRLTYQ